MDNESSIVTVDKVIKKSKQWTLEGDCTLLQWMDQISKNLAERATQTNSALTEMATKLDRTSVALSNATNNLAALQYSQFVENRVHDDDETLANIAEVPTPSADITDNVDVNHNVYRFLKKNLEMMNSCHEAYSISYEDSDEDEPATNVVYRSKNPYEARALPHIYGSTLWKEKWHIGLCDSDNDFSGDEESEQFSSSSSTDDESYESTAPTISEWDSTAWGLNTSHLPGRKESQTPSNDAESSGQGDNYSHSEVSTPRAQRILPIVQPGQDQRYYQHVPRKDGNQFHDIFNESEKKVLPNVVVPQPPPPTATAERRIPSIPQASLITDEPPPDVESSESDNNRRIGAKKTLNLFDDDEFSSFMDQIVQTAQNKGGKEGDSSKESAKEPAVPNLFEDSGYTVQQTIKSNVRGDNSAENTRKNTVIPNLFDDTKEFLPAKVQETPKKPVAPNLFNNSEESLPKKTVEPAKKTVIPNLFDDSDMFMAKVSEPSASMKKNPSPTLEDDIFQPPPSSAVLQKTKIRNLFDDDEDDDDFERIFAAKTSGGPKFAQNTKDLFEDDLGEFTSDNTIPKIEDVPVVKEASVQEKAILKKGLFDEDEDDFQIEKDIFSNIAVKKNSFEDIFSKGKTVKSMPGLGSSLFGEVEEDASMSKISGMNDLISSTVLQRDPSGTTLKQHETHQQDLIEVEAAAPTNLESKLFSAVQEVDVPSKSVDVKKINFKTASLAKVDLFADDEPADDSFATSKAETQPKVAAIFADDMEKLTTNQESSEVKGLVPEQGLSPKDIMEQQEISREPSVSDQTKVETVGSSKKKKINVTDIFADDFTDDFDELIPKLGKSSDAETPQRANRDVEEASPKISNFIDTNKDQPTLSSQKIASKVADIFGDDFSDDEEFIPKPKTSKSNEVEKTTKLPYIAKKPTLTKTEESKSAAQTEGLTTDSEAIHQKDPSELNPTSNSKDQSLETTNRPTTMVPIYTSLFHDEPPPDDDNLIDPTYEEPSGDEDSNGTTLSKAAYNSINLFADVPPDDDFPAVAPAETKRIHSIFYDDFHETMEASREMRAPSSYIFNDEPPPDDTDEDGQSAKGDAKQKTKVIPEHNDRPKVSKLKKTDLQINVGALLPTARIPSFKSSENAAKTTVSDDDVTRASVKSPERNLPDNILPNLNRDRAKVQVKRRPSTRKGRQESYRKSMIEDKVVAVEKGKYNSEDNIFKKPTPPFEEVDSFGTNVVEEFQSSTTVKEVSKLAFSSSSKIPHPDTGPGEIFKSKKEQLKTLETAKIMDSLFDSDGVDENPFGTPTKTIETLPQSAAKTQVASKSTGGLFEEPPASTKAVPRTSTSVNPSPKSTSLFGESDDGSDDLFKESKTPKKPTPQKTTQKQSKPKAVSQPAKAPSSLFSSDEETGSVDDVFGKSKAKAAPKKINKAISKPSASLFASDDDDDDLFGTAKKKSSTVDKSRAKATTTRAHPSKTPSQPPQKQSSISNNPLSDLLGP